jgi:hypothetical protein
MQHKQLATVFAGAVGLTLSTATLAKEWSIVPGIAFQYKNLSFDETLSGSNVSQKKGGFDADLPTLALSLAFAYQKFFVSLKYEDSFESNTDSDVPGTNPLNGPRTQTSVTRTDFNLSVGYNVWQSLNVFIGYLDGETELEPDPVYFDSRSNNLAWKQQNAGGSAYRQTYEEAGWFLGVSYGWAFTEVGTLSLSGAYAWMDGSYKDNFSGDPFKFEGDSQGFSLGLTWSAPLTNHVGYYLDLRRQAYDFDGSDKSGNFPGLKVKTEEVITGFTAGIQWYL